MVRAVSPRERFEEHCRRGELAYQWDAAAGRAVFYPRNAPGLEWRVSAGAGAVYSLTWVHPRDGEPYNVALIDLDEGFRMMSRVRAEAVAIGARVQIAFEDGVPVFDPC